MGIRGVTYLHFGSEGGPPPEKRCQERRKKEEARRLEEARFGARAPARRLLLFFREKAQKN